VYTDWSELSAAVLDRISDGSLNFPDSAQPSIYDTVRVEEIRELGQPGG
jgi:hypothetical protein